MYSFNEYLVNLRKELINKKIASDFIEEFLDNYSDQLESMKEELMTKEQLNETKAMKTVLDQCEPLADIVNHVVEQCDSTDISTMAYRFFSPNAILLFIIILRIFVIFQLFSIYIDVYLYEGLIRWNVSIFVLLRSSFLFLIPLVLDVWLSENASKYSSKNLKFTILVQQSTFNVYYRIILILWLIPALVQSNVFIEDTVFLFSFRIQIVTLVILTVSLIEWMSITNVENQSLKQLLKNLNPLALFFYYICFVVIFYVLSQQSDNNLNILLTSAISLFLLLGMNLYWRTHAINKQISEEEIRKNVIIWLAIMIILLFTTLFGNAFLLELVPAIMKIRNFIQILYFFLFLSIVILFTISVPKMKNAYVKLWLLLIQLFYIIITTGYLISWISMRSLSTISLDQLYQYLNPYRMIHIPISIVALILLVSILLLQKEFLRNHHSSIPFYSWSFRAFLFFTLYELGTVNSRIMSWFSIGGGHQNFLEKILAIYTNDVRLENVFVLGSVCLLFIILEILLEIFLLYMCDYESGFLMYIKSLTGKKEII